ncbi:MAG: DUF1003 domain-containing protein [Acidisphaera sp.]|nr:DUF1003 domain-containing protein [Acidisphaera sp.]
MDAGAAEEPPRHAVEHVDTIVRLEQEMLDERSFADRLSDRIASFVGTIGFVVLHVCVFSLWAVLNTGLIPLHSFDPYPFALLCMIVSLEGVLLSTFVLIKQNRMGLRSDRRSHLDLQINLLTEKEVTKVIQMLQRISERLELPETAADPEAQELANVTAVETLARHVHEQLPD